MNLAHELGRQIETAASGSPWHGDSLADLLEGLDAQTAAAHPIAGAHSIWELVLHLRSVQALVMERMAGQSAPFVEAEAWPAPDPSADERWQAARDGVLAGEAKIAAAAAALSDDGLDAPVAEGSDRGLELVLGHLQHNVYHMGQIALLSKAVRAGEAE